MASLHSATQPVHVSLTCANAAPSSALRQRRTHVTVWDPYWAKWHCRRFLSESLPLFLFANHDISVALLRHPNHLLCDWLQQAELNLLLVASPLLSIWLVAESATFILITLLQSASEMGDAVAQLVEALSYKPEGRGFDFRWCHWNFLLT
jgi:hypothetical protein